MTQSKSYTREAAPEAKEQHTDVLPDSKKGETSKHVVQPKLTVGAPDDPFEKEADAVADNVMRMPQQHFLQMKCTDCVNEEEKRIRRKPLLSPTGNEIIQRLPDDTDTVHRDLIELYRAENGFPPNGIDPQTGTQVGPTDGELKYGGILDAWIRSRSSAKVPATQATPQQPPGVRNVPAPATAPTIVPRGKTNVVPGCAGATDIGACRQHQSYIQNTLPQAIANIGAVKSPYSAAIHAMYSSALPAALTAAAPAPGSSVTANSSASFSVTFGTITHTFTKFGIMLQNWANGSNGQAFGAGGAVAFIQLNNASHDALLGNIAGVEETMVHEAMHILVDITEAVNAKGGAAVNSNLDRSSYATIKTALSAALLPFITEIGKLPSFGSKAPQSTAQHDADFTAGIFINEAIARAEAGIYAKQRAGQAFAAADLRTLPVFIYVDSYWEPKPPVATELPAYIKANQSKIDTAILPHIYQAGEMYLNLRP